MKRILLTGVVVAFLSSALPSTASPITVVGWPAVEADGNCFPFGCGYSGEYQQVYSKNVFTGPITIIGLEFYNTATNDGASFMNSGNWTIALSTTARDWDTLSSTFGANIGADNSTVFSGNLSRPWAFGDTLTIDFTTPFTYDPAYGNLLMDVLVTGATDANGHIWFDASAGNTTMGRTYNAGNTDSGYGLVTGFESSDPTVVPEPASLLLLGTGLIGLVGRAWRKRRQ
jgi:hypothetical protein